VTTAYLDTSAAMKLIVEEAESAELVRALTVDPRRLAASWLLHTELHCAAGRNPQTIAVTAVSTVLGTVTLVDVTRGDLLSAGTYTPLRSNDAILTYDEELATAAERAGIRVSAPAPS
jgi:predicted nucleic acid-binding protein